MRLISEHSRLSEMLLVYPVLIPILNRFGIRLGVGDERICDVCKDQNINSEFFVVVINTLLFEEYVPTERLKNFGVLQAIDYLTIAHKDYLKVQLANIERHIGGLIRSAQNNNLALINQFFQEYKQEISALIVREEMEMFPHILRVYELYYSPQYDLRYEGDLSLSVQQFGQEYDAVNEKLFDLKNIIIKYLHGDYDVNVCYAVVVSLNHLEQDMNSHLRLQERVLKPMVLDMETSIKMRGGQV